VASKNKYKKVSQIGNQQLETGEAARLQPKTSGPVKPAIPGRWQTNAVIFLLLIVATLVLYNGDLHLGFFAVDDPQYVVNNPWIRGISGENLSHIMGNPYFANYSPLHLLSYMLDYSIAGPDAFAFHLSSNLWAGIVAGFVFLVALALTGNRVVAIASAALFVVHPVHVEAVAWISSRKDLVAAAFALPSLLAYLYYRKGGSKASLWYAASLLLFLFAVSGKLSVATFPVVFLAIDLFVKKRTLLRSLIDKVPFLMVAVLIAMVAASAQPQMGNRPDAYVLSYAFGQNLWLLSGFGSYVIYRVPPVSLGVMLQLAGAAFLLAVFIAPLLFRRRLPMTVVFIYWILFAFIPAQVLSFSHPVTDRYLFFLSVAAVILIAWGVIRTGEIFGKKGMAGSVMLLLIIAGLWVRATFIYLGEWRDPRSVWHAAAAKSSDPIVSQNLGSYYMEMADRLGTTSAGTPLSGIKAQDLASKVWAENPRLSALLPEWAGGQKGGPIEKEFQDQLRTLAWDAFELSLQRKGNHIMPGLYYNRGLILLNRDDLQNARKEFLAGLDEASREGFAEVRQQITVYCHTNLGIIAWKTGDYGEALRWFRLAEEEQIRFGGNWVPDLTANRKRLEGIIASMP